MPSYRDTQSGDETEKFVASCSCGWELERDPHAANLDRHDNRNIADTGLFAHEFAHDFAGEEYETEDNFLGSGYTDESDTEGRR